MSGVPGYSQSRQFKRAYRRAMLNVGARLAVPPLLIIASDITGMYHTFAWLLIPTALVDLVRHVRQWIRFIKTFGLPPLEQLRLMQATEEMRARHTPAGESQRPWRFGHVALSIGIAAGLLLVLWAITGWLILFYLAVWSLAAAVKLVVRRVQPPVVALLGASGPRSSALLANLQRATAPFPISNCLRVEHAASEAVNAFAFYSYRTLDPHWQTSVTNLVRCAQIIVVDARVTTSALDVEMRVIDIEGKWDRTLIVGPPRDAGSARPWISEGEAVERIRERVQGPYLKTQALDRKWFHDPTNGYFAIRAPHEWRTDVQPDPRSKVNFTHPSSIGVGLTVLARVAPPGAGSGTEMQYREFQALFPGARIEQRGGVRAGVSSVDAEIHDDNGVGHGLVSIVDVNGLRVSLTFGAPTRALYDEFVEVALKSFDTLKVFDSSNPVAQTQHAVANRVRMAQLAVEAAGYAKGLELLYQALEEFPGSAEVLAEIARVQRLRGKDRS